jgi:hypothetical protein
VTLVAVAQLLHERVAVGEVFDPRELFADLDVSVADAERRMRDLTTLGWQLHSYRQDATVPPRMRRLVAVGQRIWEPGVNRTVRRSNPTTRQEVEAMDLTEVPMSQLLRIHQWMTLGHREPTIEERWWDMFRRASPATQTLMRQRVAASMFEHLNANNEEDE